MKAIFLTFVVAVGVTANIYYNELHWKRIDVIENNLQDIDNRISFIEETLELDILYETNMTDGVRITYYEPVSSQCDDTPLVTANGSYIDTIALHNKQIRWCAISRDLEKDYPMGSEIEIFISESHRWNGKWKVMDRTSARLTKTIDILSNTDKGGCYNGTIKNI